MTKTILDFEQAMAPIIDLFAATVKTATETMATDLVPLVKELEASDIAKEYKLALMNRMMDKLSQEQAATEAFLDALT